MHELAAIFTRIQTTYLMFVQAANYKPPFELLDTMDNNRRNEIVFRTIRKNTITLMTRSYGRGTGKLHVYT
jgi:hypothetical protein